MTFEPFVARFPEAKPCSGGGVMVQCPAHQDRTASLAVSRGKNGGVVLKCHAGCETEDVVRSLGLTMKDLFASAPDKPFHLNGNVRNTLFGKKSTTLPKVKPTIDKIYSYTDKLGREVYQAVRLKPKSFRQRHQVNGQWVWKMDGVERVLYRLPEVQKAKQIWIVEGEKDADNLARLGFCATCNVGGAKKWLDGYSSELKDKDVVICGDNDEPGQEHAQLVFDSIANFAASVKLIRVPEPNKDVSDLIQSVGDDVAKVRLADLVEAAHSFYGGTSLPIYRMSELQPHYAKLITSTDSLCLDLSKWLPSFKAVRRLTPGSFALFVADTNVGKTAILQNIADTFKDLPTIFFQLELSKEDMYERSLALKFGYTCADVEKEYLKEGYLMDSDVIDHNFPNLYICSEPRLTVARMEEIIIKSELKIGKKPVVAMLDYFQLMKSLRKGSRYERASEIAEDVQALAISTNTIIIGASQIERASGKAGEVGIHSAKDTGSLENSARLVVGARRDKDDSTLLHLDVLKAKGGSGTYIACNIDGACLKITERTNQPNTEDVSKGEPPPE